MYEKLLEMWIGIWFFIVPIITVYNVYYSQKLIKKIEKVELQQQSVDMLCEVKRLINMYEEIKNQNTTKN